MENIKSIVKHLGIFIIALALSTSILGITNTKEVYGEDTYTYSTTNGKFYLVVHNNATNVDSKYTINVELSSKTNTTGYQDATVITILTSGPDVGLSLSGGTKCVISSEGNDDSYIENNIRRCIYFSGSINSDGYNLASGYRSGGVDHTYNFYSFTGTGAPGSPMTKSTHSLSDGDSNFNICIDVRNCGIKLLQNNTDNSDVANGTLQINMTCNHDWVDELGTGKYNDTTDYGTCYGERKHYKCSRCGTDLAYGADSRKNHTLANNVTKTGNCNGLTNGYKYCTNTLPNGTKCTHTEGAWNNAIDHTYSDYTYENNNGVTNGYRYHECSNKVTAHRKDYQYNVILNKGSHISSVSGAGWYNAGSKATIDATADAGYGFSEWTGSTTSTTKNYTLTNSIDKAYNLTANANIITYKITYNLNGGTVDGTNPTTYTVETADINLLSPDKDEAKFIGWTGSNGSTPQESVTIPKGSTGDRTYTANYAESLTVIYHNDNGNTYSQSLGTDTTFITRKYSDLGWTVPDNKKFSGWYNSTYNVSYGESQSVDLKSILGFNNNNVLHLYANLVDYEQTLYFDGNKPFNATSNVLVSPASKIVTYGKSIGTLPTPSLTGWSVIYNGNDIWSIDNSMINSSTVYEYKQDKTAKVNWEPNYYNIEYDLAGGNFGECHPTSSVYDEEVSISNPTRSGYTFKGWTITGYSTSTSGHTSSTWTNETSALFKNLTPINGATVKFTALWQLNTGIIAIAQWQPKTLGNYPQPTLDGWKFIGWYDNKEGSGDKTINGSVSTGSGKVSSLLIVPDTSKFEKTLYARWQRTIHLTFNMNQGTYQASPNDVVLTGIYYTNADGYEFSLDNTLTKSSLPDWETQQNKIDAYGTYGSNGENSKFTYTDINGVTYRFLGWSLNPNATEPDTDFIVYKNTHKLKYRIHKDTTLYAVWEPVLVSDIDVSRTLGNLNFDNGSSPKTTVKNVRASDGLQELEVIIKPGEQGQYTITSTGRATKLAGIEFDSKITDIYTHPGTWTDNLNPSTPEDLVSGQGHGLNRKLTISSIRESRKFYIPQYLGTSESYETSKGVYVYTMNMLIQQDSYYYKGLGKHEEIPVTVTIYITPNNKYREPGPIPPGIDPVISVLDELRTKLKIRLH